MIIQIKDFDVLGHLQLIEEFKLLAQLDRKNTQTRQKIGTKMAKHGGDYKRF